MVVVVVSFLYSILNLESRFGEKDHRGLLVSIRGNHESFYQLIFERFLGSQKLLQSKYLTPIPLNVSFHVGDHEAVVD